MGEIEVALTEEFETTVAEQAEGLAVGETDGEAAVIDFQEAGEEEAVDVDATVEGEADVALGGTKVQHAARERGRARQLFEKLTALPVDDPERQRIRGELVELHLPLVEYLARRFRTAASGSTT